MQLRATRLTAISHAVRNLFAGASLDLNFAKTGALDPRVTFARASGATRVNASGALEAVAIDGPRFDYDPVTLAPRGLLIEEQRTNGIRNSTGGGAVVGTPGTLPTNWAIGGTTTGLTTSVVGTGTANGINYVDIRFVGTAGAAINPNILFETSSSIAAANGQSWAWSIYFSVVAGSLNNVTGMLPIVSMFSSVPTLLGVLAGSAITPTGVLQRYLFATTTNQALTAFVRAQLQFSAADGAAIDITLRIGLPQLELGAFATSPIPTTTAAATRAADVAVMTGANFSNWYRQDEGSLFVEGDAGLGTLPCFASIDDATTNNRIQLRRTTGDTVAALRMVSPGGSIDVTLTSGSAVGANKQAASFSAGSQNAAANGVLFTGITPIASMPTVNRMDLGVGVGSTLLNGHLRRIAFFPRRLSNSELEGITK